MIRASVEKLGFKFTDIKIILGSHAHGDHMEGDAMAKELTAARVMAMEQDVPALKKMMPGGKPHPIDRVLHDGDEVKLGGSVLTAHLTAGHTKGCTTWSMKATEAGKTYDVVIVCSVGFNAGYVLVNNKDYPQIADDYVRSFATLRKLPCDVFLAAHGSFYDLEAKYAEARRRAARIRSSITPDTWPTSISRKSNSTPSWSGRRTAGSRKASSEYVERKHSAGGVPARKAQCERGRCNDADRRLGRSAAVLSRRGNLDWL